jgi:molecular chaperone GrpE
MPDDKKLTTPDTPTPEAASPPPAAEQAAADAPPVDETPPRPTTTAETAAPPASEDALHGAEEDVDDDIEAIDGASVDAGTVPPGQLRAIIEVLQSDLDEARRTIEVTRAEIEAANERVLRAFADVENMRKRVEREKEEIAKYAVTKLVRDVVLVADNFERAIASVPADAREDNPALASLLDGVTLTEREFMNTLERYGVKRVAPLNEPFNPHQHQAVMEQANPDVPSGTVLQVFQVGYLIEDRVLRPAMVVVSTGGPKTQRPGANGSARNGAAADGA